MEKLIRKLNNEPTEFYSLVKSKVLKSTYSYEYDWQKGLQISDLTETQLLREAAWVVINSGFKEKTARKHFGNISLSFGDWESAEHIVFNKSLCVSCALDSFGNNKKIHAIADIADAIYSDGFDTLKERIIKNPIFELSKFPFIGPITVWHLAKNIGCNVAKPDRHIVRLAESFGFECVQEFCGEIAEKTGDKINVVDIIFWRYFATLH